MNTSSDPWQTGNVRLSPKRRLSDWSETDANVDEIEGTDFDRSEAAYIETGKFPYFAQRSGNYGAEPGMDYGYYVYSDGAWLRLFDGGHRLV